jgi:hypothetical protein
MNTYLITAYAKLFSIHRVVQANSKAEAAAQTDQAGIRIMWIEESPEIEE